MALIAGIDERLVEARRLTKLGWRLHPVRGKKPLTAHGVYDATTDMATITRWLRRWPDMNLAVACGLPGPQVLDVDDLDAAGDVLPLVADAPTVASGRDDGGRHFYLRGEDRGTIKLDYGELRGRGSYAVCPPSIHLVTGKQYVWLIEPDRPLLPVPPTITRARTTAGRGEHTPPAELVPHGHRHDYLTDFVVRLARAGVTDEQRILAHLQLQFRLACEPLPAPEPGSLEQLAAWAARTAIADRERRIATAARR
jgi:hypothetical protein